MAGLYDTLGELFSFGTGSYDRTRQNLLNYEKDAYDFKQLKDNDAAVKAQAVNDLGSASAAATQPAASARRHHHVTVVGRHV